MKMREAVHNFIDARCEEVLSSSKEYAEIIERLSKAKTLNEFREISIEEIVLVQSLCYKKGWEDKREFDNNFDNNNGV